MRNIAFLVMMGMLITGCDDSRVYQTNHDFDERLWLATENPTFSFTIQDTTKHYNLICNLRNSVAYPYTRIFINYSLQDSAGNDVKKEMASSYLFDEKTGVPNGSSGLGDIYDQQLVLLKDYDFQQPGSYSVKFEQFMRTDTLSGVLAIGLRVETTTVKE